MLELDLTLTRPGFELRVGPATLEDPVTGVFGHSGAGKSSLLHCICGLSRPTRGRIILDGQPLLDTETGIHLPPERRRVGVVFQEGRLFPHLSVLGNLRFAKPYVPVGAVPVALEEVVELLEIRPLLDRRPGGLSGGERQRVAIARALLQAPRLLLMDEPFSAVDVALRRQILPFLRRIREALAIPMLVVSHDLPDILQLTDRLLLLRGGRVIGRGGYLDLLRDPEALGLMRGAGMLNVLDLKLKFHRADDGVSVLVPAVDTERRVIIKGPRAGGAAGDSTAVARPGDRIRLCLRPEDITLALAPIESLSAQNQVPGTVEALIAGPEQAFCIVDAGLKLVVEITLESMRALDLREGKPVWCLFKARALHGAEPIPALDGEAAPPTGRPAPDSGQNLSNSDKCRYDNTAGPHGTSTTT